MRKAFVFALLLSATSQLFGQATDAASDHVFVVGNRSQPFMPNHRESIQAAINAALPNGTVIIPTSYAGQDCNPISLCNPGNVIVIDWRSQNGGSGIQCLGAPAIVYQSAVGQQAVCDVNFITDGNGNIQVVTLTASTSITAPIIATTGPGGVLSLVLQAAPTNVPANTLQVFGNIGSGFIDCRNSAGNSCMGSTQTIASGSTALHTNAITSGGCDVTTATATGATVSTDKVVATPQGDPTGITGYVPSTSGILNGWAYLTANTVNFKICNNTANTITPGALTLNWSVIR